MATLDSDIHDDRNEPVAVAFSATHLTVTLRDGRAVSVPLWWYPRLFQATSDQRARYELMRLGVHWPDIDEDISVRGLLLGNKAPGAREPEPA